jgi:hypothetical protein
MVTRENCMERQTKSHCCDARIEVVYRSIRSNGEMIVWRCGRCENGYIIQSEGALRTLDELMKEKS